MFDRKSREVRLDALLDSPAVRKAEQDHHAGIAARRVELATERAAMEKTSARDFHNHQAAAADIYAEHQAAAAALKVAKARMAALQANRTVACHQWNIRISDIEVELRETADPAIDQFIAELRDALDVTLKARFVDEGQVSRTPATGQMQHQPGPRRVQPSARAQAIRDAIAAAEGLKLEPKQGNVAAHIAALRAALPTIGELAVAND